MTSLQSTSNQKHTGDTIFSHQVDQKMRRTLSTGKGRLLIACGVKNLSDLSGRAFGEMNQQPSKCSYPINPLEEFTLRKPSEKLIKILHL